jgi:class 3 adenylate cyclase
VSTSDFHPSVRTVLASFLFVDIVGFSKVPAAQQHAFKAGLIAVLHRHLVVLHRSDYRLRDTGDGALISFLTNPEHALYVALAIAQDLGTAAQGAGLSLKDLRTGMNLGAVKESIDVEQRPNYVGDGINAAQRIMDFAQPGQITASRSFMEAVAHLDASYAALFQHLGSRADKHGRQHEFFSISPSEAVLVKLRGEIAAAGPEIVEVDFDLDRLAPPMTLGVPPASGPTSAPKEGGAPAWFKRPWALWLVALVLAAGLGVLVARLLESHEPAAAQSPASAPATAAPSVPAASASEAATPASEPTAAPASASAAATEVAASPSVAAPVPASTPPATPRETAPPRTARKTADNPHQPPVASVEAPAPAPAVSEKARQRCSQIMQKAGVGEPLSSEEKKELANSCR